LMVVSLTASLGILSPHSILHPLVHLPQVEA
jgi:hypothetical protein